MKNKTIKGLLFGIFAGLSIALGGTLYLVCKRFDLPILGSFLFSEGLLLVCTFKLNLFTGKIGYVFVEKKKYALNLIFIYLTNLIGALLFGFLVRLIAHPSIADTAKIVSDNKLANDYLRVLGTSFYCGVLVYMAVDVFKNKKIKLYFRVPCLILCVALFVMCGFDHCIADMYYFAVSNSYSYNFVGCVLTLLIVTIGNSCGAIFTNFVKEVATK